MSELLLGDSAKQLKKILDNSVDLIATDPPYGYSFMGKHWDKALPDISIWKECLRVLKPGAFAFIMAAPRQDVLYRMMMMLEEAGFIINYSSIYWSYASGFPKSLNLGKKSENKVLQGAHGGFQLKPAIEVIIVVQKPLQEKSFINQALEYADEMMNKEQFIEEYDVRNVFQDKLFECGEAVEKTFPFLIVPKASKSEKNKGLETFEIKEGTKRSENSKKKVGIFDQQNNHPTVKPVKLMSYLITLATRPEDIVLDPFMGSGTTGVAAKKLNRQFIGIEMDSDYIKIAEARIDATDTDMKYKLTQFWR